GLPRHYAAVTPKLGTRVTGWEVKNEGDILKLHMAWKVKNFVKGLEFFQLVAAVAEEEGLLSFAMFFIFALSRWSPPRSSPCWSE
uniref:4a-hydroxytetrahydrobiopterin dehydratase n=1 Tax=Aegilops tauschii subsp. strangulata TaxID=200361 RepID=A0A453PZ17_AEGTS